MGTSKTIFFCIIIIWKRTKNYLKYKFNFSLFSGSGPDTKNCGREPNCDSQPLSGITVQKLFDRLRCFIIEKTY